MTFDDVADVLDQGAAAQMSGGHVHRYRGRVEARIALPRCDLRGRSVEDPSVDFGDQVGPFGRWDELVRSAKTFSWVVPANERFEGDRPAARRVEGWLEEQFELVFVQRDFYGFLKLLLGAPLRAKRFVTYRDLVFALRLCPVDGHIRVAEQFVGC